MNKVSIDQKEVRLGQGINTTSLELQNSALTQATGATINARAVKANFTVARSIRELQENFDSSFGIKGPQVIPGIKANFSYMENRYQYDLYSAVALTCTESVQMLDNGFTLNQTARAMIGATKTIRPEEQVLATQLIMATQTAQQALAAQAALSAQLTAASLATTQAITMQQTLADQQTAVTKPLTDAEQAVINQKISLAQATTAYSNALDEQVQLKKAVDDALAKNTSLTDARNNLALQLIKNEQLAQALKTVQDELVPLQKALDDAHAADNAATTAATKQAIVDAQHNFDVKKLTVNQAAQAQQKGQDDLVILKKAVDDAIAKDKTLTDAQQAVVTAETKIKALARAVDDAKGSLNILLEQRDEIAKRVAPAQKLIGDQQQSAAQAIDKSLRIQEEFEHQRDEAAKQSRAAQKQLLNHKATALKFVRDKDEYSLNRFFSSYGDAYVDSVTNGRWLFIVMQIHIQTKTQQTTVGLQLNGIGGGMPGGVSVDANFNNQLKTTLENLDYTLQIFSGGLDEPTIGMLTGESDISKMLGSFSIEHQNAPATQIEWTFQPYAMAAINEPPVSAAPAANPPASSSSPTAASSAPAGQTSPASASAPSTTAPSTTAPSTTTPPSTTAPSTTTMPAATAPSTTAPTNASTLTAASLTSVAPVTSPSTTTTSQNQTGNSNNTPATSPGSQPATSTSAPPTVSLTSALPSTGVVMVALPTSAAASSGSGGPSTTNLAAQQMPTLLYVNEDDKYLSNIRLFQTRTENARAVNRKLLEIKHYLETHLRTLDLPQIDSDLLESVALKAAEALRATIPNRAPDPDLKKERKPSLPRVVPPKDKDDEAPDGELFVAMGEEIPIVLEDRHHPEGFFSDILRVDMAHPIDHPNQIVTEQIDLLDDDLPDAALIPFRNCIFLLKTFLAKIAELQRLLATNMTRPLIIKSIADQINELLGDYLMPLNNVIKAVYLHNDKIWLPVKTIASYQIIDTKHKEGQYSFDLRLPEQTDALKFAVTRPEGPGSNRVKVEFKQHQLVPSVCVGKNNKQPLGASTVNGKYNMKQRTLLEETKSGSVFPVTRTMNHLYLKKKLPMKFLGGSTDGKYSVEIAAHCTLFKPKLTGIPSPIVKQNLPALENPKLPRDEFIPTPLYFDI